MPQYEVDYWNERQQVRIKRVTVEEEKLIPFALRKLDREFDKIHKIREIKDENQREAVHGEGSNI
jgi:hypothetical protein